jgi:hypothetical protein
MAKTFTAPFAQTPKRIVARVTTAHATLNSTTNTVLAYTAGSDGAIVTRVAFTPTETVTAGVAYLYESLDSGTTIDLLRAKAVAADTVSTTDVPTEVDFGYTEDAPLRLQASERLYVAFSLTKTGTFTGDAIDF